MKSNKYRFKWWFQWLFKDEWEEFENEMRDLEWDHIQSHKWELGRGNKALEYLEEHYNLDVVRDNNEWKIEPKTMTRI